MAGETTQVQLKDGTTLVFQGVLSPAQVKLKVSAFKMKGAGASPEEMQAKSAEQARTQGNQAVKPEAPSIQSANSLDAQHMDAMNKEFPNAVPQTMMAMAGGVGAEAGEAALGGGSLAAKFLARILGGGVGAGTASAGTQALQTGDVSGKQTAKDSLLMGAGPEALGAAFEAGGKLLAPSAMKTMSHGYFGPKLDAAGGAIDQFLKQPQLAGKTINNFGPTVDKLVEDEIALAQRTGSTPMARQLRNFLDTWHDHYNFENPTLTEVNEFRRDISKMTNFASESTKETVNKVEKMINGATGKMLNEAAPGIQPLNDAYADLVTQQSATRAAIKDLTTGKTGVMTQAVKGAANTVATTAPTAARVAAATPNTTRAGATILEQLLSKGIKMIMPPTEDPGLPFHPGAGLNKQ